MTMPLLQHWHTRRDPQGVLWAALDRAHETVNTLSASVLEELSLLLEALDAEPPAALVIESAKPGGFIAGADLKELGALDSEHAARALVGRGWAVFNQLATSAYPTLALIRGHCLGGGLELALACRYRLAVDLPGTRLGLPEVKVGLVPGWGGIRRLPHLVGPTRALDLMLTGKTLDARRAAAVGLVDRCVPERVMMNAARELVFSRTPPRRASLGARLLAGLARPLVAAVSKRQLRARVSAAHYPAPYALVDIWADYRGDWLAVPPAHPASVSSLLGHPTTANLLRVFQLQERLKSLGKGSDFRPKRVHVIGAGVMGGDIAAWCAQQGMVVSLQDTSVERIAPAIARAARSLERRLTRAPREIQRVLDRLLPDPEGHGVASADVAIEAIHENLDAKRALLAWLEPRLKPGAVLGTNTSSLRLEDLAVALREPGRLVGIHFFNPVAKMPLVEVVSAARTDPAVAARALGFVRAIDKLPLPCKSAPGFLVNAVLGPYLHAAMQAVDEGAAPEVIDRAATEFGMPMGPITLLDTVGLDVALAAGQALTQAPPPRCLVDLVEAGHLGQKTGRGFYRWQSGSAQTSPAAPPPPELTQRLIEPLVQAARRCLAEGVVSDADLVDAGVIFGTGFAPHTGGPLNFSG